MFGCPRHQQPSGGSLGGRRGDIAGNIDLLEAPLENDEEVFGLFELGLKEPPLPENLFDFFSIKTEFLP